MNYTEKNLTRRANHTPGNAAHIAARRARRQIRNGAFGRGDWKDAQRNFLAQGTSGAGSYGDGTVASQPWGDN